MFCLIGYLSCFAVNDLQNIFLYEIASSYCYAEATVFSHVEQRMFRHV